MSEHYEAAAIRHYRDAEHLAMTNRFENAGHLVGFSTECAIKHLFRLTTSNDTPRQHLPLLAASMRKRFSARNPDQASMHQLLERVGSGFFSDWKVDARYEADGCVDKATYEKWRNLARRCLGAAKLRLPAGEA